MYHAYWGLRESPFAGGRIGSGFFESSTHEEALARLHFLVEQRRRLGLVLGGSGLGKSYLLEAFAEQLRLLDRPVARLNLAAVGREEVLELLADAFRLPGGGGSPAIVWRRLNDYWLENAYQQQSTTILLDDADQAEPGLPPLLTRMLHSEAALAGRLTLVPALPARRAECLGESLLETADLRIDLEPWTPQDTAGYLQAALLAAGGNGQAFEPRAVERLHELAAGIPRRVCQLADFALLAGASQHLPRVDERIVSEVDRQLRRRPAAGVPA